MVNNGGRCKLAIVSTFCAERILFEEQRPGRSPLTVVASLGGVLPGIQLAMSLAIYSIREVRTARMPAWSFRFSRHEITSQYQQPAMIVDRISGTQVLHSTIQRHHKGNCAVNLFS